MKSSKKLISLVLGISMLMPAICACTEETPVADTPDTTIAESTAQTTEEIVETEPVDKRLLVEDGLPDKKFDGQTFTMYLRGGPDAYQPTDFVAEESSGDILANAVYERNRDIMERFDIKFKYNYDTSNNTTFATTAMLSIQANEDVNDILGLHGSFCFNYAAQGILIDWNKHMTHNDLTKPWWDADFRGNMTIADKLYGMTGSISHNSIGGTFCILFNKDILKKANLDFPYEAVRNGTWTFDKFRELCSSVTIDLNGDGVYKPENDQFGLYSGGWRFPISAFYMGGDRVYSSTKEGLTLTVYNEQTVSIIDKLMAFYQEPSAFIDGYHGSGSALFREGRALFWGDSMKTLQSVRDYEMDIGMLPYPKFDDTVSRYYSLVDAGENVFAVPVTASRLEMISIITEALAAEGYKKVVPAFYEIGLKAKYARDAETAEMLEIITDSRWFDFGYYNAETNRTLAYIGRSVLFNKLEFTSYCKSVTTQMKASLDKLYENFTKNES